MRMLSKKRQDISDSLALHIASDMFATWQNPKDRGPRFTWGRSPELVAEMARGQIALYDSSGGCWGKDRHLMEARAGHSAFNNMMRFIELSGVT